MHRAARGIAAVALVASACNLESTEVVSNGAVLEGSFDGVVLHAQDGVAPNTVLVRAVDGSGTSGGPSTVQVQLDGSAESLETDPFGYAILELEAGVTTVEDQDVVSLDEPAGWPDLSRVEAPRPPATEAAAGRRGMLVSSGSQVWWTGPTLPDHPVAELGATVTGLRAAQLDADGVIDAVVWGGDRVVLLRGRDQGGAAFGAGVRAEGWTVQAAAAGDLDDDGDVDVAMAWDTGNGTLLQVWGGEGAWSLAPVDESAIVGQVTDMVIARDLSDGKPVITLLVPEAEWQRYRLTDGVIAATGNRLSVGAVQGSRLFNPGDLSGDGVEELIVVEPRREGAVREIDVWDLSSDRPVVLPLEVFGGWLATGDLDTDGVSDLWLMDEDGTLTTLRFEEGQFTRRDAGILGQAGPLAVSPVTSDDTVPDLLVASSSTWVHHVGQLDDDEPPRWSPRRAQASRRAEGLVGPLAAFDTDALLDEVAGVVDAEGQLSLRLYGLGDAGPVVVGSVGLGASRSVLDLAGCGSRVWVLLEDEVVLVDTELYTVVGRQAVSGPRTVACRDTGTVRGVVTTDASTHVFLDDLVPDDTLDQVHADAAIVGGEVVGCDGPCIAWPWTGGVDALVTETASGLSVQVDGQTTELPGGGALSVQDSNGDGELELWARAPTGVIAVLRASAVGPVLEGWRASPSTYSGPALVADGPGVGTSLWFADGGDLVWLPGG